MVNVKTKKRTVSALLSAAVAVSALSWTPVWAADGTGASDTELTVIVELTDDAVLEADDAKTMGAAEYNTTAEAKATAASLSEKQNAVMDEIEKIYPNVQKGFSYTHAFNGFSATVRESDIEKIERIDGVKSVSVSPQIQPTDAADSEDISAAEEESLELMSCCEEIGADYMHDSGYNGEGRAIAIIDSAFDVNHEYFSGEITDPKYSKADIKSILDNNTLNVETSANQVYRSEKIPFAYNYANNTGDTYNSTSIHGTHVAGIAGGNNGTLSDGAKFESVAPESQLILMALSTGYEKLDSSALLAAIDDAAKFGVDAINLSLGSGGMYMTAYEEFINNAANAGIIVSCAASNSGRNIISASYPDYSTLCSPGNAAGATSVASSNAKRIVTKTASFDVDGVTLEFAPIGTTPRFSEAFSEGAHDYVYCGAGADSDYADVDVTGKIALVDRGGDLTNIVPAAKNHGAVGLILINDETQELGSGIFSASLKSLLPACYVSHDSGQKLINAENKQISNMTNETIKIKDAVVCGMSDFSSWGAAYDLKLKPEITTPGGYIYSSLPDDDYDNASGTSMAAPHLTGAAALMYQYIEKNYSGKYDNIGMRAFAENLMMSSAAIVYEDEDSGIAASPRQQGAGELNLKSAVMTPVYLVGDNSDGKSKITLGDLRENRTFTLSFEANNFSGNDVTYDAVSFLCETDGIAQSDGVKKPGSMVKLAASVSGMPESVTVPAGGSERVSFDVTLDETAVAENLETFTNGFWVDGFVILSSSAEGVPDISIPYTGFYGGWEKSPLMDKIRFDEDSYSKQTYLADSDGNVLGVNSIAAKDDTLTSEETEEYNSESYAGIPGNSTLTACNFALRAVDGSNIGIVIKDTDSGEVVYQPEFQASESPIYYYFLQLSLKIGLADLKDGNYAMDTTAHAAFDSSVTDTVSMKFYIDSEKPKILSHTVATEDGKTMLNMSLSDNRYLMGVIVKGKDTTIYEPIKAQSAAEVNIDISGVEDPEVTVYDYAYNSVTLTESGKLEIVPEKSVVSSKNAVIITANVTNDTGAAVSGKLAAAVYDTDGTLKGIDLVDDDAVDTGTTQYSFTLNVDNNPDYTVKFFVWNSLDGMKALADSPKYTLDDMSTDISGYADINIVHTNDIHGYYKSTKSTIGFEKLKTIISACDADLVLDIGDTFHGQSFATVEEGKSIAELMNFVGYDAMTPGNHDWSYGADKLKAFEEEDGFKILASNVTNTSDGDEFFDTPYLIKEVKSGGGEDVKVGVVGVIDDKFHSSTASENVAGLTFDEESAAASKTAKELRESEGCDIVVAITHQHDCEGFVSGISGIDAVIAGHEHKIIDEEYTDADGNSVPVYEAGYYFGDVGCVNIVYDPDTDKIVSVSDKIYTAADTADMSADEAVSEKITEIEDREKDILTEVIGTSAEEYPYTWEDVRIAEQPIGKAVTAAYLARTGADAALENAGGIRGKIPKGTVTYSDLLSVSPYGNTIVTKHLTGEQLLDILETSIDIGIECDKVYTLQKEAAANGEDPYQYSWPSHSGSYLQFGGIELEYDTAAEKGSRITSAEINGAEVAPDTVYTVAMNNYVAENSLYPACANAEIVTEYGTCEAALRSYIQSGALEN